MATPDRSPNQKTVDAIFGGAPYGLFTSDEGLRLKNLQDINRNLEKHHTSVERSLAVVPQKETIIVERQPQYMPSPDVIIDTSELARAQDEVADQLAGVIDAQRDLADVTREQTPLFQRMIRNQGISQDLQREANRISEASFETQSRGVNATILAGVLAYKQRNEQMEKFTRLIHAHGQGIVRSVDSVGNIVAEGFNKTSQTIAEGFDMTSQTIAEGFDMTSQTIARGFDRTHDAITEGFAGTDDTISAQAEMTRDTLHQLFADIGGQITEMTNDQVITRIAILQSLYRIRTTFIQTHEQQMLSFQQQIGLLERILQAVNMTEHEKESRYLWRMAEHDRKTARTQEDFEQVLSTLKDAHAQDRLNPLTYVSSGVIHGALGHPEIASTAFAEADLLAANDPELNSYILMNLGSNLMRMGRYEHAERVLRKATKIDPTNKEVWFSYGKAAWMSGKRQNAIEVMKRLVQSQPAYYKAHLLIDADLTELYEFIISH